MTEPNWSTICSEIVVALYGTEIVGEQGGWPMAPSDVAVIFRETLDSGQRVCYAGLAVENRAACGGRNRIRGTLPRSYRCPHTYPGGVPILEARMPETESLPFDVIPLDEQARQYRALIADLEDRLGCARMLLAVVEEQREIVAANGT